jgi:hypothetical protein
MGIQSNQSQSEIGFQNCDNSTKNGRIGRSTIKCHDTTEVHIFRMLLAISQNAEEIK